MEGTALNVDEGARVLPLDAALGPRQQDVPYQSLDEPFRTSLRDRAINGQYANIYFARLAKLRPAVLEQMRAKWELSESAEKEMLFKTLDVPQDKECIVLGTFYADMKLKPNVLEEYTRDPLAPAAPTPSKYCGADDRHIIEDETGRLTLSGALMSQHRLVTGVVFAAKGRLDENSSAFIVSDICLPGLPPQAPFPPTAALADADAEPLATDRYLALVSGLLIGADGDGGHLLALQLLCDFLSGHVGGRGELGLQTQVVRLVVCGGLLAESADATKPGGTEALKPMRARARAALAVSLQALETMLLPVASCLPVDLMPGSFDPSNLNLPQQPLHQCLLPLLARHASFRSVTNPHAFELCGLRMAGTSGQPVSDVEKYVPGTSPEQTLEDMLRWRHLAPTAPDTLPCFPFAMADPFVLPECPHLFFAGNQPQYGTRHVKAANGVSCRIVAVPVFASTRTAVLVNLRTLRCHPVCFEAYGGDLK